MPGKRDLEIRIIDPDGGLVCEPVQLPVVLAPPDSQPESIRQTAPIVLTGVLPHLVFQQYGEFALDIVLDRQPLLRTRFYVYPAQN